MSTTRRRSLLIDHTVQRAIIQRCVFYWLYCLLTVSVMLFGWALYQGPPRPFGELALYMLHNYAPALGLAFLLLPIVVIDVVRFSHTIVGPMYRLRSSMQRLAVGERVEPVAFRDNDFWPEMAETFNALVTRVQTQKDGPRSAASDVEEGSREQTVQFQDQAV